jgi:L-ribulose-5-phosphate 3-epimerase UlaE
VLIVQLQFHFVTTFVLFLYPELSNISYKAMYIAQISKEFYSSVNHLDALALKQTPVPSNCGITRHSFTLPFCFVF